MQNQNICLSTLVENLTKNGFIVEVLESSETLIESIENHLSKDDLIGNGGSVTIDSLGIYPQLQKDGYNVIALNSEYNAETKLEKAKLATAFFTSTNAVAETGEFVNIDGRGNRLSQMCYGAPKIFYIFGENKITKDVALAIDRVRNVASPLNARRLNKKTPCVVDLKCHNCSSPDRICKAMLISAKPTTTQTAYAYILKESLGY